VLIDDRGDVKICDFGLSKLLSHESQMTVQVRTVVPTHHPALHVTPFPLTLPPSMQVGTPAFMSPEMAEGSGMSEAVDVYSFGVLLWTLWACQNPYHYLDVTPVQLLSRCFAQASMRARCTCLVPHHRRLTPGPVT
jgi:serine/threonine protein kinase